MIGRRRTKSAITDVEREDTEDGRREIVSFPLLRSEEGRRAAEELYDAVTSRCLRPEIKDRIAGPLALPVGLSIVSGELTSIVIEKLTQGSIQDDVMAVISVVDVDHGLAVAGILLPCLGRAVRPSFFGGESVRWVDIFSQMGLIYNEDLRITRRSETDSIRGPSESVMQFVRERVKASAETTEQTRLLVLESLEACSRQPTEKSWERLRITVRHMRSEQHWSAINDELRSMSRSSKRFAGRDRIEVEARREVSPERELLSKKMLDCLDSQLKFEEEFRNASEEKKRSFHMNYRMNPLTREADRDYVLDIADEVLDPRLENAPIDPVLDRFAVADFKEISLDFLRGRGPFNDPLLIHASRAMLEGREPPEASPRLGAWNPATSRYPVVIEGPRAPSELFRTVEVEFNTALGTSIRTTTFESSHPNWSVRTEVSAGDRLRYEARWILLGGNGSKVSSSRANSGQLIAPSRPGSFGIFVRELRGERVDADTEAAAEARIRRSRQSRWRLAKGVVTFLLVVSVVVGAFFAVTSLFDLEPFGNEHDATKCGLTAEITHSSNIDTRSEESCRTQ